MLKLTWQEKVIELEKYQQEHSLSVRAMALVTGHSIGKISTDLNLGAALRAYPELHDIKNYIKAILFIKKKRFRRALD